VLYQPVTAITSTRPQSPNAFFAAVNVVSPTQHLRQLRDLRSHPLNRTTAAESTICIGLSSLHTPLSACANEMLSVMTIAIVRARTLSTATSNHLTRLSAAITSGATLRIGVAYGWRFSAHFRTGFRRVGDIPQTLPPLAGTMRKHFKEFEEAWLRRPAAPRVRGGHIIR